MKVQDFIFGYGSLIESESRLRTTPEARKVYPVIVKDFKRGWFARTGVNSLSTTFLGCVEEPGSLVNGVIYKVDNEEIKRIDKREKGYSRIEIDNRNIEFLFNIEESSLRVWIYVSEFNTIEDLKKNMPDKNFPIVQSYVDMCINGCFEIERDFEKAREVDFTKMFIQSTEYWNRFWANDRIYPRRPFIYTPNANRIDLYLKKYLRNRSLFDQIYIE